LINQTNLYRLTKNFWLINQNKQSICIKIQKFPLSKWKKSKILFFKKSGYLTQISHFVPLLAKIFLCEKMKNFDFPFPKMSFLNFFRFLKKSQKISLLHWDFFFLNVNQWLIKKFSLINWLIKTKFWFYIQIYEFWSLIKH
jgi:hypothetical protein